MTTPRFMELRTDRDILDDLNTRWLQRLGEHEPAITPGDLPDTPRARAARQHLAAIIARELRNRPVARWRSLFDRFADARGWDTDQRERVWGHVEEIAATSVPVVDQLPSRSPREAA